MENRKQSIEDIIRKLGAEDDSDAVKENFSSNTYKTIVSWIISLPPKQFILLSSLIGILLIDGIDAKEQIILGKFINNVGQTILTAATQEQINKKDK